MERLTKRNQKGDAYYPYCFKEDTCGEMGTSEKCNKCDFSRKICEKLADYEDLEEQGLLLKIPCKMGDTLYYPYIDDITKDNVISKEKVAEIGLYYRVEGGELSCYCSEIDKTVFLTREEAEDALKRMEREG